MSKNVYINSLSTATPDNIIYQNQFQHVFQLKRKLQNHLDKIPSKIDHYRYWEDPPQCMPDYCKTENTIDTPNVPQYHIGAELKQHLLDGPWEWYFRKTADE